MRTFCNRRVWSRLWRRQGRRLTSHSFSRLRRLQLEPLPRRDLLSGLAVVGSGAGPVATDDQYLTLEDSVVTRNMVTDDTGRGSDTSGPDGLPLIVTEIDGHAYRPAAAMTPCVGCDAERKSQRRFHLRSDHFARARLH